MFILVIFSSLVAVLLWCVQCHSVIHGAIMVYSEKELYIAQLLAIFIHILQQFTLFPEF